MAIHWYPGHMVTARKDAIEAMRRTDVVIEVLDARVPRSSCNPVFETLRRENQRPALKILNKADIADPARTRLWLDYYNALPNTRSIALSAKRRGEVQRIVKECLALAPGRTTGGKPLRMMILGIPNVGKSTLMNTILNRPVARVGDEPAITKLHMRHEIGPHQFLTDTPGMLWPGVAQDVALKLAATHSIGRNAYEDSSVAIALADYLLVNYRDRLITRYGALPDAAQGHEVIAAVAARRSLVIKGGAPDLEKASTIFLQEFREAVLGPMTLEVPEIVVSAASGPTEIEEPSPIDGD